MSEIKLNTKLISYLNLSTSFCDNCRYLATCEVDCRRVSTLKSLINDYVTLVDYITNGATKDGEE